MGKQLSRESGLAAVQLAFVIEYQGYSSSLGGLPGLSHVPYLSVFPVPGLPPDLAVLMWAT